MKAITICQPYAWLITRPETDPRHKRVENRTWSTDYRGPIAIHAGLSRDWLRTFEDMTLAEIMALEFGKVVAVAYLFDCVSLSLARRPVWQMQHRSLVWVADHIHAEGPRCWVLTNVRVLDKPIPAKGKRGLWDWTPPLDFSLDNHYHDPL